jgi:Ser/Thr protein kinase RdoA (MazF antagonist)
MKLHIVTQIQENYGAHGWDGEGECPQHWKMKGGQDYMVADVRNNAKATETIMLMRDRIESNTVAFREQIIGWDLVKDNFLTEFERDQLTYDGSIAYPATVLTLEVA